MNKEKGFSIIELVTVIGIIALITAIIVPSVILIRNSINEKAYNTKKTLIEKTAKMYVEDNLNEIKNEIDLSLSNHTCNKSEILENGNGCACEKGNCKYVYNITVKDLIDLDLYKSEKRKETDVCHVSDPRNTKKCLDDVVMNFYIEGNTVIRGNGDSLNSSSLNVKLTLSKINDSINSIKVKVDITGEDSGTITKYFYKISNEKYNESENNTYEFTDLAPGTSYEIKVFVENKDGLESEVVTNTFSTSGTSFKITIPEYQKVVLSDVPKNFTVKYAQGNKDEEYFKTSGTDITESLKANVTSNSVYTFALINTMGNVMSIKKIYIYNYDGSSSSITRNISDSSITSIEGETMTNNGTASASLSGSTLTLKANGASSYTSVSECSDGEYYCPYGGYLRNYICAGDTYSIQTTVTHWFDCETGEPTYTDCVGNCNAPCPTGYTHSDFETIEDSGNEGYANTYCYTNGILNNSEFPWIATMTAYCVWDGDYYASWDCTDYSWYSYYHYTIGVLVK